MEWWLIPIAAFVASLVTFFSGFGLGTLLMPIFAIWFPLEIAVALTAIVHLLNNLFKLILVARDINWPTVIRFGLPAIFSAALGASLLLRLSDIAPITTYTIGAKVLLITPIKLLMGCIIIVFTVADLLPKAKGIAFSPKLLPLGGIVSGFFGGLSGHQGALRSAFLIRLNLGKEGFVATGTVIACLIDFARLGRYLGDTGSALQHLHPLQSQKLVLVATIAAFVGAFLGNRILKKVTHQGLQKFVGTMLIVLGIAMVVGFI